MPVPPDRPTLSVAEFWELLAGVGHPKSKRVLQRIADEGMFGDRYPGWKAHQNERKHWLISPA